MRTERLTRSAYFWMSAAAAATAVLSVSLGSVGIPVKQIFKSVVDFLLRRGGSEDAFFSIVVNIRLPRVLSVALVGASLSLSGGAMQGLLRNPLADASTVGVSSGAALGAVVAIAFGLRFPSVPFAGTAVMAMLFACLSLAAVVFLASRFDVSLSTGTIILLGVVFSMFAGSIISFLITFNPEKIRSITFWTMGSLSGSGYPNVLLLAAVLAVFGTVILGMARELNAFALGEDTARHIGVDVRRVKLTLLAAVSAIVGVTVSVGGAIGFVGLIMPHMVRMLTGPNHRRLLPASMFAGAIFLMLADLAARTLFSPRELPVGVVTSFIGAIVFIFIFRTYRRRF